MYALYKSGLSCRQIAQRFKCSRQTVHSLLRSHGLATRPSTRSKSLAAVFYKGIRYAPERGGYLRSTMRGHRKLLHHVIWEEHHGPVPKGHVIRCINGDYTDCRIENLECMTLSEYLSKYHPTNNQYTRTHEPLRDYPPKKCAYCGSDMKPRFSGVHPEWPSDYVRRRFCSRQCARSWRRGRSRRASLAKADWRIYAQPKAPPVDRRAVAYERIRQKLFALSPEMNGQEAATGQQRSTTPDLSRGLPRW